MDTSSRRAYAASVRQGTKKKSVKRKITDMPGYKERVQQTMESVEAEVGMPSTFIKMFGPNSNYPPPPPEPKPTGKYAALFPGEEEVPKETEMLIGELDREYDRVKQQAAIALQDPDYIIYDSLVQYRIQELELEWLGNDQPVTRETKMELEKKIEDKIFETQAEFEDYFSERPRMSKLQLRQVRQTFLNEMEGRVHFFPQDRWKLQLIDPQYDLEKHPLSLKERIKLFTTPTAQLAANPKLLYQQYRELSLHVSPTAKAIALPTERILAHFDLRKHKEKLIEMEKKDLEAELAEMEFETDMLLNASDDSRSDEGDFDL